MRKSLPYRNKAKALPEGRALTDRRMKAGSVPALSAIKAIMNGYPCGLGFRSALGAVRAFEGFACLAGFWKVGFGFAFYTPSFCVESVGLTHKPSISSDNKQSFYTAAR